MQELIHETAFPTISTWNNFRICIFQYVFIHIKPMPKVGHNSFLLTDRKNCFWQSLFSNCIYYSKRLPDFLRHFWPSEVQFRRYWLSTASSSYYIPAVASYNILKKNIYVYIEYDSISFHHLVNKRVIYTQVFNTSLCPFKRKCKNDISIASRSQFLPIPILNKRPLRTSKIYSLVTIISDVLILFLLKIKIPVTI